MSSPSLHPHLHLTLNRGWPNRNSYVWSPFVTKLELRLRLSAFPYAVGTGATTKAPKGKVPYVELRRENGHVEQVGDSTLIIKHLTEGGYLGELNGGKEGGGVGTSMKVQDLALKALLEDRLYFYSSREKWLENYYIQRDYALWSIPYPVRVVIGFLVYRKISGMLQTQGTGRYTTDEIRAFRLEIWEAVNELLDASLRESSSEQEGSEEPFWCLGGKGPTEVDTTLYGFVVSALVSKS
ncbi:MAG: hypothetical protein MMC33_010677 [Icmadophila ericetorum]|nr:hypothetical protein [Icmadophila ericetorum]